MTTIEEQDEMVRDLLCSSVSCVDGAPGEPTVLSPDDVYNSSDYLQIAFFGCKLTMEEKDALVMKGYKEEFWPERLKKKENI